MTKTVLSLFACLLLTPALSSAQLVDIEPLTVDFDLGSLSIGGTAVAAGDTSNDPQMGEARVYFGVSAIGGALWGYEDIYQLEVTEPMLLRSIRLTGGESSINGVLLDSTRRSTRPDLGTIARDGVEWYNYGFRSIGQTLITTPGTYYLSVTPFQGIGNTIDTPQDPGGEYNINLTALALPTADSIRSVALDLGVIAQPGMEFSLTTFGSAIEDTELALYNSDGTLLLQNDDAGGAFQSGLLLSGGLEEGEYFAAVGSFNAVFSPNFVTFSGADGGGVLLNYAGQSAQSAVAANTGDVAWFRFSVAVPEPASSAIAGLSLVVGCFARRRAA